MDIQLDSNAKLLIIINFQSLCNNFTKYFLDVRRDSNNNRFEHCQQSIYSVRQQHNVFNGSDDNHEEITSLRNDPTTQDTYKEKILSSFWSTTLSSYPKVASTAICHRNPLCQPICVKLASLQCQEEATPIGRLPMDPYLWCALSTMVLHIDNRVTNIHHHPSH